MKLVPLWLPLQQMRWSKTFVSSSWEATLAWLHCGTINFVVCRSNNKNIVSAYHQAERVDHTDNCHHNQEAPTRHETVYCKGTTTSIVPHNNQLFYVVNNKMWQWQDRATQKLLRPNWLPWNSNNGVPRNNDKPCGPIVNCQEQRQQHHPIWQSPILAIDCVEQRSQKHCSVVNHWRSNNIIQ